MLMTAVERMEPLARGLMARGVDRKRPKATVLYARCPSLLANYMPLKWAWGEWKGVENRLEKRKGTLDALAQVTALVTQWG